MLYVCDCVRNHFCFDDVWLCLKDIHLCTKQCNVRRYESLFAPGLDWFNDNMQYFT